MTSSASVFEDYYEWLGVPMDAEESVIKKAYRSMALKYHPDKNQDKPEVIELFHRITKANEVLTDPKRRAEFDAVVRAKKKQEEKLKQMDTKRRRYKEDLEERERAFKRQRKEEKQSKAREEYARETTRRMMEEEQLRREQQWAATQTRLHQMSTIKLKWKRLKRAETALPVTENDVRRLCERFGRVSAVRLDSGQGYALVRFDFPRAAEAAANHEWSRKGKDLEGYAMKARLNEEELEETSTVEPDTVDHSSFEQSVLERLMRAGRKAGEGTA